MSESSSDASPDPAPAGTPADPLDPQLVTFGCRMNTYESEVMRSHARAAGLENAIIINTCAVTREAERQSRQAIRKLRRDHPDARIIVTGCAAQINPDQFAAMGEVDQVLGNAEKLKAESYQHGVNNPVLVDDIMEVHDATAYQLEGFEGRTRAFVQVQQGCDHRCTFCIIPYARGPSRSVPIGSVVEQVRSLMANGYREVTLTGVDITGYGEDLPGKPPLGQMVRRLLQLVPDLPRLRLTSLDPVEVDDDLMDLFGREPRLLPHVHLSVQAGDDMILKRMKRRHLRQDVIDVCQRLRQRRPDVTFGADLIAGFPTEDDAMFANSLSIIEEAGLTHLHVFPYSARPGTPAAKIPGLPGTVVKDRAARLREAGDAAMTRCLQAQVGATVSVLMESETEGHSEHFLPVRVDVPLEAGTIRSLRIVGASTGLLKGVPV